MKLVLTSCFVLSVLFTLSQTKDTVVNKRKNYFSFSAEIGASPIGWNADYDININKNANPLFSLGTGYERRFKWNMAFEVGVRFFYGQFGTGNEFTADSGRVVKNTSKNIYYSYNIETAFKKDIAFKKLNKTKLTLMLGLYEMFYYHQSTFNTSTLYDNSKVISSINNNYIGIINLSNQYQSGNYNLRLFYRIGITKQLKKNKISILISNYFGNFGFTTRYFNPLLSIHFYV